MKIVLGGGLSGLFLASNKKDSLIIENQPKLGGVFTYEEILNVNIPFHPPLVNYSCEYFQTTEIKLRIYMKKENYILRKIYTHELPRWLVFNDKMLYVTNLIELIDNLSKKVKVLHTNIKKITQNNKIITTNNILSGDKIFVTISRKYIADLLGIKNDKLRSISMLELIVIVPKKDRGWDVYINGDNGISYSHIINAYWISNDYDILYVLIPFTSSPPIWDKVFSDLKRENIFLKDEILAFRSRIIRDAILIGEDDNIYPENIKFCGRLGKWKNFTLCEAILDSLNC
ncbi:NAD(P)/FAD-dependent oxidoreductase [Sulfolobus sp. S-194]|uniref:NAD(P)/FAD-dependent oxidoreductase n=1 Tax=Sulfolobus sp. S-194 TaxID=2512240 RepID=UPI0014370CBB|nr:NAD(P)/FAD-dependent oxidoreductase [Sulfolobus sp. S-194]QIW23035.1 NAD(P)/FAD-dependent oxidoreductase [Sulfolobus sp. S-194]